MAAKKKTDFVSPNPKNISPKITKFEDLGEGDAFIYDSCLCIKTNDDDQEALFFYGEGKIDLDNDLCGEVVIPVTITGITWTETN